VKSSSLEENGDDDPGPRLPGMEPQSEEESSVVVQIREKTRSLMCGKASCERKWRDCQLAHASILRAVLANPSMTSLLGLLRRVVLPRIRLEHELWCPLSEEFAVLNDSDELWLDSFKNVPTPVTQEHFQNTNGEVRASSGLFPSGTRVVIFSSAADGFGTPKSDIDMCLQLPENSALSDDDPTGSDPMAKLAQHLEDSGMIEVDTVRLTARIPAIKYRCANPLASASLSDVEERDELIEHDLSMYNPLAVLNTTLLQSYSDLTPMVRILASAVLFGQGSRH
jgi:predicted nucleotidyltransferase